MASPIGHALAGLTIAWLADLLPVSGGARGVGHVRSGGDGNREAGHVITESRASTVGAPSASWYRRAGGGLAVTCMALAAAPDLDLLITGLHRTATHSFFSVIVAALAALSWPRSASRNGPSPRRIALVCGAAWASHIVVDWMSADSSTPRGMQILWPFADAWFISGWDVFPGTERRRLLSGASLRINIRALVTELALLLPILGAVWLVRVKALTGLPSELARSHHPAE